MKKSIIVIIVIMFLGVISISQNQKETHDEWHTFGGKEIVCRFQGCGQRPLYSDWADRFCSDHIDMSEHHKGNKKSIGMKRINNEPALTDEQAKALEGTGYGGTRPNSSAEISKIKAAKVKCKKGGMHSTNGLNSLCNECKYNESMGFK